MIQVCTSSSQTVLALRCGFLKSTTTGCVTVYEFAVTGEYIPIHTVLMYTSQSRPTTLPIN